MYENKVSHYRIELRPAKETYSKVEEPTDSNTYYSYNDDGDAVRDWYLRCDNLLLLITYSCADDNAGMDDSAVNEILETLFIKTEPDD